MGSAGLALLRLLSLLLALLSPGSTEELNALVGTTVQLKVTYSGKATGYTWTKGNTRVAEWDEPLNVTYYETLKGRCELDTSTGVLNIRDLKEEDSAGYKGEALVDNHYVSSHYDLRVFPSLKNPTVTCNDSGGNYTIFCTHRPEPPTYSWHSKDGLKEKQDYSLSNSKKTLTLKDVKVPFQSLECVVQNPVSSKSTPLPPDCFEDRINNEGKNNRGWGGFIAALIICSLALAFFVVYYVRNFSKTPGDARRDPNHYTGEVTGVLVHQGTGNDDAQGNNANPEYSNLLEGGAQRDPNNYTDEVTADYALPLEGRDVMDKDAATNNGMEEADVADNTRHQKDEDNSQARPDTYPNISSSHHSPSLVDINGDKTESEANRNGKES